MSCTCAKKQAGAVDAPHLIRPDQPCVYCAEKHFAAAMQMAKECGYVTANRQAIVGEIVLSQWHLYMKHYSLAEKLRDLRHTIQMRKENEITDEWGKICLEFDRLIGAAK